MSGFYSDIKADSGVYKFYVNGEWKESTSGKSVSILNPTSNQAVYQVQGEEQCMQVLAFHDVFKVWHCDPVVRNAPMAVRHSWPSCRSIVYGCGRDKDCNRLPNSIYLS